MGMNNRERIMATLHKERVDRMPFFSYWRHLTLGQVEREVRNRGMGLCYVRPCYIASMPHVETVERSDTTTGEATSVIEYHTSLGTVTETWKKEAGVGSYKRRYGWRGVMPRRAEYLIKKPEDYDIVKFMVEDTRYQPYYEPIKQADRWVGNEGIVMTRLPYSPLHRIMIEWTGVTRFYIDFFRDREKVMELYRAAEESYERLYEIAADAPVDVVNVGGNIDDVLVNPLIFEKYYIPAYDGCARVLHDAGKFMATHFDGRVGGFANLIRKCPQDIIEALTPPPLGNLPIHEAMSLWKDKIIWMNFPESVCVLGTEAVKRHLLELLMSVIPGDRLTLITSTEHMVPEDCLLAVTDIMEKAMLPLSMQSIFEIQRSLH